MQTVVRRVLIGAAAAGAAYFTIQGGQWSTTSLIRQRREIAQVERETAELRKVVDTLQRYVRRLQTDPALQERVAREEFGMVRGDKELVYKFVTPDTTRN